MNNYPFNQVLNSRNTATSGGQARKPGQANQRLQFAPGSGRALPSTSFSTVKDFMQSEEQPFGKIASSNESSSLGKAASMTTSASTLLGKQNQLMMAAASMGQNGALLANNSSRQQSQARQPGSNFQSRTDTVAANLFAPAKIDYKDSYDSSSKKQQRMQQAAAVRQQQMVNTPQNQQNQDTVLDRYRNLSSSGMGTSKETELFNRLLSQADNGNDEVEVVQQTAPTRSIFDQYRMHKQTNKNHQSKPSWQNSVRYPGNSARYVQSGGPDEVITTTTVAQQVYRNGNGSRQFQAFNQKRPQQSLLGAQERQSSSVGIGGVPKPQLVTQTTSLRENQLTGRLNQVTIDKNGQEMIELDDDDSSIDIAAIQEALDHEPTSPIQKSSGRPLAGRAATSSAGPTSSQLLKQRTTSQIQKSFYSNILDKTTFNKVQYQPPQHQSSSSSNLPLPIQKLKAMQSKGASLPSTATQNGQFQQRQGSSGRYGVAVSSGAGKVSIVPNDPLQTGHILDSTTKRLVQRKRREVEEKAKLEEKTKLLQKMQALQKEKEKRKRKAARKEEDELADILGLPKPSKKSKSKTKEVDLDFLDRDQKELNALLVDSKDGGGEAQGTAMKNGDSDAEMQDEEEMLARDKRRKEKMARQAQEKYQKEQEAKAKVIRFHQRNKVDELIKPILSLELVQQFYETDPHGKNLGEIPQYFENHVQYMDSWIPLFLFETYNQMISQKSVSQHDRAIAELLGSSEKLNREFNFRALIEKGKVDFDYVHLRLFDADNTDGKDYGKGFMEFPVLQKMRDNDLILFSEEPLEGVNQGKPVKKICNADFLMGMARQEKSGIFLACVTQSRKKDANHVEIRVDAAFVDKYFRDNYVELFTERKKLHCYYFDSLTTIVREFQTIKKSEFYATHDIILDPVNALSRIEADQNNFDNKGYSDMSSFIQRNEHRFNESQTQALTKVAKMYKKDLLLIQGPPGTGKTHTIHGIISMLNCCKNRKILVCAPSNAAIDEIVSRIISNQFSSETRDKVVRVGAMDYDPQEDVKKVTLDYKLEQEVQKQLERGFRSQPDINANSAAMSGSNSPINGQAFTSQTSSTKKASSTLPALVSMNVEQKKKALIPLKRALFELQRKEFSDESLTGQVKDIFAVPSQFANFLNNHSRCVKIDTLEAIRKELEPKPQFSSSIRGPLPQQQASYQAGGHHRAQQQLTKKQRRKIMLGILSRARIVCTTLAMSASEMFSNFALGDFEYLIVDEACQSVELTNLIPFQHEPSKVILVGDQQQLPATVFSENGNETKYSRSMFERFLQCGVKNYMLCIQYRMHPKIRQFPSDQFYGGKLEDAQSIVSRTLDKDIQAAQTNLNLEPSIFFDLAYGKESAAETSKQNSDEVKFIIELLFVLAKHVSQNRYNESDLSQMKGRIGIISPYKSQVRQIKLAIQNVKNKLCLPARTDIEVNTVDAYQGREKDIIIISTVRTGGIGFLRDYRRMNVAITRAKHFLWVVGNKNCLQKDENWNGFVQQGCQKSYTFSESYFTQKKKDEVHYSAAQELIERTLKFQKVQPAPAKKSQQNQGGVAYNQLFSSPTSPINKRLPIANKSSPPPAVPSSHRQVTQATAAAVENKIVPQKFTDMNSVVEKGVTFTPQQQVAPNNLPPSTNQNRNPQLPTKDDTQEQQPKTTSVNDRQQHQHHKNESRYPQKRSFRDRRDNSPISSDRSHHNYNSAGAGGRHQTQTQNQNQQYNSGHHQSKRHGNGGGHPPQQPQRHYNNNNYGGSSGKGGGNREYNEDFNRKNNGRRDHTRSKKNNNDRSDDFSPLASKRQRRDDV